jgi:hypothetical protein
VAKYHGRKGEIALGLGSPGTVIGSLSSWSLSFARDKVDVTSFQDANKQYLVGLKDVSGSFEGFFDTNYISTLYTAGDSDTGYHVKITPSTDVPTYYFEGFAWLDLSLTGAVNDAIKVSCTLSANGDWAAVFGGTSA